MCREVTLIGLRGRVRSSGVLVVSALMVGVVACAAPTGAQTRRPLPGAPTDVTATPGDGTALVSWLAATTSPGEVITGYQVKTSAGLGCHTDDSVLLSCTVSRLVNGASDTVEVRALAHHRKGTYSTPVTGSNPSSTTYPGWASGDLLGESGSDNAANYVAATSSVGSITYIETAYAKEHSLPVASLVNASGADVQPTSANVATALQAATLNPDLTQNLADVYTNPQPGAYPLSAYSYLVTPCAPTLATAQGTSCDGPGTTSPFSTVKGEALGHFVAFLACAGQEDMSELGYSPLPVTLVQDDFAAIGRINGAVQPPAPTPANCPNPNVVDG